MGRYVLKDAKDRGVRCETVTEARVSMLDALELIEQRTQKHPWSAQSLGECFSDSYRTAVLFVDKVPQGFAVIYNTRFSTDLLSIGVDPEYQGRGYGRFLLRCILREALDAGADECFLEVRVSNERAISLYKSFGFEVAGLRRNYYSSSSAGPAEDAYTMVLHDIRKSPGMTLRGAPAGA
jgi:ribosomal-protein-alanine N-acetyltransferase